MNRKIIYASMLAVLAAQAVTANAAQTVDLARHASTKSNAGPANAYQLTDSRSNELQMAYAQMVGNDSLIRFEQYHLGVPVFGGSFVVEAENGAYDGRVKRANGSFTRGLEFDVASATPAIEMTGALDAARRALRVPGIGQAPDGKNTAHLYVWRDAAGKGRLVYAVSLTVPATARKRASRPTVLVDANTSAILDRWESFDANDGMGPGGYLRPVANRLAARGWDGKKIGMLFSHARNLYQVENSAMAATTCGAAQAAADLGFSQSDVRSAFAVAGRCLSNTRKFTLSMGDDGMAPTASADAALGDVTTKAIISSTLTTKNAAWRKFTNNDFTSLKPWDTAAENLAAAKAALGIPSTSSTRADVIYINNVNFDKFDSFPPHTSSLDYCSRSGACVDIRTSAYGKRAQSDAYTAWSQVSGLNKVRIPAQSQSTGMTLPAGTQWSMTNTKASSWAYTVSSEVTIGAQFTISDSFGWNYAVTFGASATKSGEKATTFTTNFNHGSYRIPAGCYAELTPVERWKLRTDTWTVKPAVQGTMQVRTYPNWNGQEYTNYSATSHFKDLSSKSAYVLTLKDRTSIINSVLVSGKRFSDGSACTLTPL